jgi:transcription antitermination factor NusG
MIKKWLVATYKINEVKRLEKNLLNQKFDFFLPKITVKKNSKSKEEALFPGYIFINTTFENYSALKYTIGIKNILKFGDNISCVSNEEIKSIQSVQDESKINPISTSIKIGQNAYIASGSLKGSIVKICSLPSKDRVDILLSFLGSVRRITIPEKDLVF